jgi:TolB-like protein/tetratricopeptide (TPR) repeat protein/DNA-binding winged helix-turn-helix (wHTH) protein
MDAAATTLLRYRVGDLIVDPSRFMVVRDGREVQLPRLSFDLLLELVRAAPAALTTEQLMDRVWPGLVVSPETVSQRVKLLRRALGDSAAEPRYVGVLRGRGYRLLALVEALSVDPAQVPSEAAPPAVELASAASAGRRIGWPWVALAVGSAGLALLLWSTARDRDAVPKPPAATRAAMDPGPSIAVLPFVNRSVSAEDALFADGIQDDILTRLAQLDGLRVIARTSVERFRSAPIDVRQIGEQLSVRNVLEGSVQRDGTRVRINLQLIDTRTGAHLWARNYDRELTAGKLFAMQSEVAQSVAAEIRPSLTSAERSRLDVVPTLNLDAWERYQAGRRLLERRESDSLVDAQRLFEQAIEIDPGFARAHAGLADSLVLQSYYGSLAPALALARAEVSARRGLELDPNLAEAITASASIVEERGEFEAAERGYQRAIAANPNYALARHWYSQLLVRLGRPSEALVQSQMAVALDPFSLAWRIGLGGVLENLGRFDEALARFLQALDIDPGSATAHLNIAQLFGAGRGRHDLAVPWLERAAALDPGGSTATMLLALSYSALGQPDLARRWLAETERRGGWFQTNYATALLARNDRDGARALDVATRMWQERPIIPIALAILRDADLAQGRVQAAIDRYEQSVPELLREPLPKASFFSVLAAVDLAHLLMEAGDSERAERLLDAADALNQAFPRMGSDGFGIEDVRILAVRGRSEAAIEALQQAERDGWRGYNWRVARDVDRTLASIRDHPEFKQVFARIERDLAEQRRRLGARPPDAPLARELPPKS